MGLADVVYVVDYDIPTANQTKRVDFYRKVHRLLRQHYGKDVKFSTQSCYFTEDEALAKKFLELASEYSKRCNLYKAVKMQ
jgi:hypothetical protein